MSSLRFGVVAAIITVFVALGSVFYKQYVLANPSDEMIIETIGRSNPELFTKQSSSVFSIQNIARYDSWFVVTIEQKGSENPTNSKILLSNKSGALFVVTGPGKIFSKDSIGFSELPDTVLRELNDA